MKIQKRQEIEFFGTKTGNANSIALGYATETKNFGEVAVGVMNKSTAAKDPNSPKGVCVDSDATLFSVGCGGSGERKNALEVKGDGSVLISGEDGNINVADKIKQALDTNASIELVKSAESDLQYTLMVNNESRGSINIPKDQFLKNVTYDTEAKQLVFTFVTLDEEEHVERISINDLKDVYTAGDGINIDNNVISADFSSVMTAISDEKTQRETIDNEIKSTLDTKADKTSLEEQVEYLKGHSFYLGNEGQVASPFKIKTVPFDKNIQETKNNQEYAYADIVTLLYTDGSKPQYIYDKSLDKVIKITGNSDRFDLSVCTDYFRTAEPLNLSHTFYLDNEKTGDTENLDELTIEKRNLFKTLPYVETGDMFEDDTAPQYIYDATDGKWIEVVETYYIESYCLFNTEEPLDLTHEFGHCLSPTLYGNYASAIGEDSIALGYNASASNRHSIALGKDTKASGYEAIALGYGANAVGSDSVALGRDADTSAHSVAIGTVARADGQYSTALGYDATAKESNSVALGCNASTSKKYSIALGYIAKATDESSIALGFAANATSPAAIALGLDSTSSSNGSIALGGHAKAYKLNSIALGTSASANGLRSIALGCNTVASADDTIVIGKNNYSSNSACYSLSSDGTPLMEVERNKKGLYLQGLGDYDGTNLVVKNGDTETLNPDIKSVQQIINDKADSSSIPTKTSQLTNDSKFVTKDFVSNLIGDFKYSTITADNSSINGLFDSDSNRLRTAGTNSVYLGFTNDANIGTDASHSIFIGHINRFDTNNNICIGNSINASDDMNILIGNGISCSHINNVIIGSGMTADVSDGYIGIGYGIKENTNAIYQIAGCGNSDIYNLEETLTYSNQHKKYIYGIGGYDGTNSDAEGVKSLQEVLADKANVSSIPNVSTKADLVDGKLKSEQLPKLDNIAAATTTEDMITKFNALLTDLKAKGYMTADITA